MPEPIDAEALAALARDLVTVSANLKRHIKEEGLKIGAELGKSHAQAAEDRIRENAVEMQRLQDLVNELRRQMKPLVRRSERYFLVEKALRAASHAGGETVSVKALLDIVNAPTTSEVR